MIKILLIILSIFIFISSPNAKTINSLDYFNPEKLDEFKKNCLNDYAETQNKIKNGTMTVDLVLEWRIKYIGFICNIYNGQTNKTYEQIIYFLQAMKENNISESNYPELHLIFSGFIYPFVEIHYPELLGELNLDRDDIKKQFQDEIALLELRAKTDISAIDELNTIVPFYIFELVKEENLEEANLLLEKIIPTYENKISFQNYLNGYGPSIIALSKQEKNYKLFNQLYNFLNDCRKYFSIYDYDTVVLGNYFRGLNKLTRVLFENQKFKKIEQLDKEYNILSLYNKIPNNDLELLLVYANTLHIYSKRLGGNSYKTYFKQHYLRQLELSELSANIIIDDIINSENIFLDVDTIKNIIEDNKNKLSHFGSFQNHFATYHRENNIDYSPAEYWRLFNKSFEISQLLSQNSLKDTIKNILVKHKIKNPKTLKLFNQKYLIEEKILKITKNKNNFNDISNYNQLKQELDKINKNISSQNSEQLASLTKTISIYEIFSVLKDGEAIIYFQQEKQGNIFYLIHKKGAYQWEVYRDSNLEKDIYKVFEYSRNISNYNSSYFPHQESYNIYENLFLKMGVSVKDFNIKDFIIIGDGIMSTFPYWLLLTEENQSFDINNIKNLSWFSKKHDYKIFTSITDFYLNRTNNITRLGIHTNNEIKVLKIFRHSLADKNNLQINDQIISINGEILNNDNELLNALNNINPKFEKFFDITIKRKEKIKKIRINFVKKNILEHLNEEINISFKNSKEFVFVGIGNPILSNENNDNQNEIIRGLFKDYETRGYINTDQLQFFPELPETEDELKNIQANFDIKKTKLFLRNDANEEAIKNANLSNTKFIVIASHALVSGEIDALKEPGIVLTPTDNNNENEGLLLASEISNLNLINTDLVVLSACNTSSASEANSIPLSGLAKSFFLAGAKSLIVSGWSVETNSAAYLSSGIFKKAMNENINFSKALQNTINEMIEKNLHPLMWAPFILVGDI